MFRRIAIGTFGPSSSGSGRDACWARTSREVRVAAQTAGSVIGRELELDSVAEFLNSARDGPVALVMRGEPGIGKTTLWQAAVARAEDACFNVMSCRPSSN